MRKILVFALFLGACDGCSSDELDQAPGQIAQAVCPRAYECCTRDQLKDNEFAATDQESCLEETEDGFAPFFDQIRESAEEGRATFSQQKLDACLQMIRTSSCGALQMTNHFSGVPGCDNFVDPLVVTGGVCVSNWECIDGVCNILPDAESGVCTPNVGTSTAPQMGGQCFYSSACSISGRDPSLIALFAGALIALIARSRRGRRGP